ncbi:4Fe-4S dicluster domain-containing protein [Desulfitobacterium sp. AusDCA]|uniref:4Fe-4S dicluster domain-containing protein n=1 Tax=Desulfitobacterium sp. AusDCA TaxID=3240383 RepID=UPI003DA79A25
MVNSQMSIYVDIKRCMNCRSCEIACKLENDLPVGPRYIMVIEKEVIKDGIDKCEFLPTLCMHCGDPACKKACPTGAIYKRLEDGIVDVNQSQCIGCRKCLWACPFGAPQFRPDGKMQKCNLCLHRLKEGELPACAQACCAEAIKVGTVEEISMFIREKDKL